jgi:hypothetical protein
MNLYDGKPEFDSVIGMISDPCGNKGLVFKKKSGVCIIKLIAGVIYGFL